MNELTIRVLGLDDVRMRLGRLSPEATKVMRMAINDTAQQARKQLNDEARQRYVVKKTKFNKSLVLKRATNTSLTATLTSKGKPLPLSYFEIRKNGKRKAGQGHQLKSTSLTPIRKEENKSFTGRLSNGHRGLFYRSSEKRYPILQVYGSSVPSMIGGRSVYGRLEPVINSNLQDNLQRHIDLVLRRM